MTKTDPRRILAGVILLRRKMIHFVVEYLKYIVEMMALRTLFPQCGL